MECSHKYKQFYLDPEEFLDYTLDWAEWLEEDSINSFQPFWDDPEIIIEYDTHGFTPKTTTFWATGGVVNKSYLVTTRINTTMSRIAERTVRLIVKDK